MKYIILQKTSSIFGDDNVTHCVGYATTETIALDVCTLLDSKPYRGGGFYYEKVDEPYFVEPCLDYMVRNI